MKKNLFLYIIVFIALGSGLYSCKENYDFDMDKLSTKTDISPTVAIPVAHASLTLADLIEEKEDTVIYESDQSITVVYKKDSLFSFEMSEFYDRSMLKPLSETVEMGKIDIDDFIITRTVTLEELSENVGDPSNYHNDVLNKHGTTATIPAVPLQDVGVYQYIQFDDFQDVTLTKGTLRLEITNNYPVAITDVKISFEDKGYSKVLFTVEIPLINSGETVTHEESLEGISMSNRLAVHIVEFASPGSGTTPIYVDKNSELTFTAKLLSLEAQKGTAVTAAEQDSIGSTEIDLDLEEEELYQVTFSGGEIEMVVQMESTVLNEVDIELRFPTASQPNGEPVVFPVTFQPNEKTTTATFDLTAISFDLTKSEEKSYNMIPVSYYLGSEQQNRMVTFESNDVINTDVTFNNLEYKQIIGYFGQKSIDIDPDNIDLGIDFFDNIDGGLRLTDPKINLILENSIGVPAGFSVQLTGVSPDEKEQVQLDINETIDVPTLQNPYKNQTITINKNNYPKVVDFIALPPDKITYQASANVNKDGKTGTPNFVSDTSRIKVGLDVRMPLEIQTDHLSIRDTIDLDIGDELDDVENATLYITTINGFPCDAELTVLMYEESTKQTIDEITTDAFLQSAQVSNGKVVDGGETKVTTEVVFDETNIDNLKRCDKLIIKASLNTANNGTEPVMLYTFYSLNVKVGLVAGFNISLD